MATERAQVDTTAALKELTEKGAVTTSVLLIQEDDTKPNFCSLVMRGYDAKNQQIPGDVQLCPPPCKVTKALIPDA